jgi:twitching motility protein PilI
MATSQQRQSLKALQERLADRLSRAKTSASEASWLAVEAGGRRCLLPLVQSGEIFPVSVIQAVPYTRDWFRGVVALRGGLMGVVDIGQLMGGAHAPVTDVQRTQAKMVAVNAMLGVNVVLLIDRLVGLRNAGMFQSVVSAPEGSPPYFSQQLTDMGGETWQEINLQVLVEWPEFLNVVA